MKRKISIALATLAMLIVAGAHTTQAQWSDTVIHVNVPFAFMVGDKTFPADEYMIRTPLDIDKHLLELRSADGHRAVLLLGHIVRHSEEPASKSELLFKSYGDANFLSQVWVQGSSEGVQLKESSAADRMEMTTGKPTIRTVVAYSGRGQR